MSGIESLKMWSPGFFERLSIRWKLTLIMLLVATVVSFAQVVLFTFYDKKSFFEFKRARTQLLAKIVGMNTVAALKFNHRDDAMEVLSALKVQPTIKSVYLLNAHGGILAEYLLQGENLSVPLVSLDSEKEFTEQGNYYYLHRIVHNRELIGGVFIKAGLEDIDERQRNTLALGGSVGLGFFVISFLLSIWLQRRFTDPIRELGATMHKVAQNKDYSWRAAKRSSDEFGVLVDGFNYMLGEIDRQNTRLAQQMTLLERTNKELDQFVYAASHDLKAPLRAVCNLSRLIVKGSENVSPEKKELIDLMQGRIKRMERLLDDLLLYSRVGRVDAIIAKVETKSLIDDIVELLDPPEAIRLKVPEDLPEIIAAKAPLQQVFSNLIGNALKHHNRPDGEIEIKWRDAGKFIEFAVADDGPGIPPQFHAKIFQMFQTLKPRDEVEGSGMGLALVKKIVEDQGGTVWVRSEENQGACFYFTWPKVSERRTANDVQRH